MDQARAAVRLTPWKTLALVAVTGDDPDDLKLGPVRMLPGSTRYSAGFEWTDRAGELVLEGRRVPEFLHQFDAVGLWHWPEEWLLDALYATGRKLLVGPVCCFDAIPQTPPLRGAPDAVLWQVSSGFLLKGTDGQSVDAYAAFEPRPPAKPHVFMCDVANPEYAIAYAEALEFVFSVHYRGQRPDVLLLDNVMRRPYYSTAPNAPPVDMARERAYRDGQLALIHEISRRVLPVWGNTGKPDTLFASVLGLEFWEHFFVPGMDSVPNAGFVVQQAKLGAVALGWEKQPPGDAVALRQAVGSDWPGHIYLLMCRTGPQFGLWYPGPGVVE